MIKNLQTPRGMVAIREANLTDAAQFKTLRLDALRENPTAFSADYQTNADQPISYWEGRLKDDENGTIFFAEFDEHLIGMTGIRIGQSVKTKHGASIWGVYVRAEWRGLHIAGALIESCIHWAKARQVNIVKLGVATNNTSAVRCYERCGFTVYGTDPGGIFYEGKYYDEYLMSRAINSTEEQ